MTVFSLCPTCNTNNSIKHIIVYFPNDLKHEFNIPDSLYEVIIPFFTLNISSNFKKKMYSAILYKNVIVILCKLITFTADSSNKRKKTIILHHRKNW